MENLIVKQETWGEEAQAFLAPACDDQYTVFDLKHDCTNGRSALFNVFDMRNTHIASMVLRIDGADTKEMVVVAAGGHLYGGSLYQILTPFVEALAADNGCKYLRGHAARKSVGRLMLRAGWEQSEIIFRKRVAHGRQIQQ